jgi:hypothetical protein
MNYEQAYNRLKIEILGTVNGKRDFLQNNKHYEFTQTYHDVKAQVESLEKLETLIHKQDESETR